MFIQDATAKTTLEEGFYRHLNYSLGRSIDEMTALDAYISLSLSLRDLMMERWITKRRAQKDAKRVYYLSMEFLMGKMLDVALDGYLVYAEYCDNGTATTADDYKPTANTQLATGNAATDSVTQDGTQNSLDRLHGHTTKTRHLATPTYHYHYMQDPTATIKTLLGGYFRGVTGSVSN